MAAGAKRLGYKEVHTGNMAINSEDRDGRPACHQIGFCMSGCAIGAKWSTLYTEIPKAESTGRFEIRPESMVVKINHDDRGRVTGVVYADKTGALHEQKARAVCVAGNSVETPRLLLNSESAKFPNGLANSSGQVGRNYMRHLTGSVYAEFDKPVRMYRGETMAGIITDESRNDPGRGFVGGYYMQLLALGLPFYAAFLEPGGWGPEFAAKMEAYERTAGMWLVGEDMPQENNRVTLNREVTDQHGLPVPNVHFDDHPNDLAMREHAYVAGESVYSAVDSVKTHRVTPYPSTHNLGTCRMSADAADGVVDGFGRAHDVPNLFVSDGSVMTTGAAANPTLTIVALAIRQAEHMVDEMKAGSL
jgi:choline dehydrogenase-like flavoprotein